MKILYILGDYKPNMSANGVCSNNVINKLLEEGHEVTALVKEAPGAAKYSKDGNLTVVRVKTRFTLRLYKKSDAIRETCPLKSKFFSTIATIINKFQMLITAPWWPVISPTAVSRFKKAAIKLHRETRFDAVISVYTPIETLLAGYYLKKSFPEIKYYPYFLDSLSGGFGPRYFSQNRVINRCLKIEKKIFPFAEKIIAMKSSKNHHEKYNDVFLYKMSFLEVPSFCKCQTSTATKPEKKAGEPIKFLYVGSISYSVRDPRDIIRVINDVREENITCEFIGKIDCLHLFQSLKKKLGDRLVFSGQLPHDVVINKIAEADVVLNIGNRIPTMIPCKIFEYISYVKPIISTYVTDDEPSIPHLKNYPLALILDCRSKENFGDRITEFLEKTKTLHVDEEFLSELYKLNRPGAFTEILKEGSFDK